MTNEKERALALATRILEQPHADPDADLVVMARQLVRSVEAIATLEQKLRQQQRQK